MTCVPFFRRLGPSRNVLKSISLVISLPDDDVLTMRATPSGEVRAVDKSIGSSSVVKYQWPTARCVIFQLA